MTAPILKGRRALVRTVLLVLALEAVVEVRRGEQEPDPAPPAPAEEREAA